jgi:hypothetical protein
MVHCSHITHTLDDAHSIVNSAYYCSQPPLSLTYFVLIGIVIMA